MLNLREWCKTNSKNYSWAKRLVKRLLDPRSFVLTKGSNRSEEIILYLDQENSTVLGLMYGGKNKQLIFKGNYDRLHLDYRILRIREGFTEIREGFAEIREQHAEVRTELNEIRESIDQAKFDLAVAGVGLVQIATRLGGSQAGKNCLNRITGKGLVRQLSESCGIRRIEQVS